MTLPPVTEKHFISLYKCCIIVYQQWCVEYQLVWIFTFLYRMKSTSWLSSHLTLHLPQTTHHNKSPTTAGKHTASRLYLITRRLSRVSIVISLVYSLNQSFKAPLNTNRLWTSERLEQAEAAVCFITFQIKCLQLNLS